MVKTCPNCKTENQDSSEFCQNCGSKLNNVKSESELKEKWDNKSRGGKVALGFFACVLGLIFIIAIVAIIYPDNTTSPTPVQTANTTTQSIVTPTTTTSPNDVGTFDNQYVSFQVPSGYEVTEVTGTSDSSSSVMDIDINKDGTLVGEVSYMENQPSDLTNMESTSTKTTTAGKSSIESSDSSGLYDDIILGMSTKGYNKLIDIQTDSNQAALYQKIKDTIVIKRTLPDE